MKLSRVVSMVLMPLVATLASADKKDEKKFEPGPVSSYATRQTSEKVTIAAVAYTSDEQARSAFGKHNPYQYGILPVLVIVENGLDEPLRLTGLQAEFVSADGRHIEAVPAQDLAVNGGGARPNPGGQPRLPFPTPKKKNPLADWEIQGRAFAAQMLTPRDSAYGFFYFETRMLPGSKIYLTGMQGARTGKELLYFEVPLDKP